MAVRFAFGFHESSAVLGQMQHQFEAGIRLTAAESSVAFAALAADASAVGASDDYCCTLLGRTAQPVGLGGGTCFAAYSEVLAYYLARLAAPASSHDCLIVVPRLVRLVPPSLLVALPILPIQHSLHSTHSSYALTPTIGLQQGSEE